MKIKLSILIATLFSYQLFSNEQVNTEVLDFASSKSETNWIVDAGLQAQSIAGATSPQVGPGLHYQFSNNFQFGTRVLMSLSNAEGVRKGSSASIQLVERFFFKTEWPRMFVEFNQSLNAVYGTAFYSSGLAIGIDHKVNQNIGFGGVAGTEISNYSIDNFSIVKKNNSLIFYPKALAFVAFYL